jgi:hypothetical protein
LGARFKVIPGYPGTSHVLLAMDRGEVEGKVSGWASLKAELPKERSASLNVLLQMGPAKAPDLQQRRYKKFRLQEFLIAPRRVTSLSAPYAC